jgi:ribosomal protein L1
MAVHISKRRKANEQLKPTDAMTAGEAVAAVKKFKGPKFDQTVNVVLHLGINPDQADGWISTWRSRRRT